MPAGPVVGDGRKVDGVVEITPRTLCFALALVCFAVAFFMSLRNPPAPRYDLVAAGLALVALGLLLP